MRLSPPITISAILAAALVVAGWLAPAHVEDGQRSVRLPASVYDRLEERARDAAGPGGTPLTVAQFIERFAAGSD